VSRALDSSHPELDVDSYKTPTGRIQRDGHPESAGKRTHMGRSPKSPTHRKVRLALRRIGVWLDRWCLRGYAQDTHAWSSKIERLRGLKSTYKQVR